jgi:hypothetical protein
MIEVRAVKDAGKIMTDSGPVSLDKGSIHFLKRYVACCAVCFVLPVQYLTSCAQIPGAKWSSLFGTAWSSMYSKTDSVERTLEVRNVAYIDHTLLYLRSCTLLARERKILFM